MRKIISLFVVILSVSVANGATGYTLKKKAIDKTATVVSTTPVVKTAVVLVTEPKVKKDKQAPAKKKNEDTPEKACRKIKDKKLRRECLMDAR